VSHDAGDSCKAEVGDTGSSVLVDENVGLRSSVRGVQRSDLRNTYPLQIPMDDTEVVHILQAIRNINQLDNESVRFSFGSSTYKINAVHMPILPDELVDIPIFHPCGNHREPTVAHCHSNQW